MLGASSSHYVGALKSTLHACLSFQKLGKPKLLAPSVLILEQYSRRVLQAILHADQRHMRTKVYA